MYQVPDMSVWKGRINPEADDLLIHQVIRGLDMTHDLWQAEQNKKIGLLGFCSDEGVRRNMGRPGAQNGPYAFRSQLRGLSVHFDPLAVGLVDAGNVICNGRNLEAASNLLQSKITALMAQDYIPLVVGGGHETTFPSYTAISSYLENKRIGIINFDAHFDMRTYQDGPHSGSSFRQIADDTKRNNYTFHYLPIGIRPEVNVKSLFSAMEETGQRFISLTQVNTDLPAVLEIVSEFCRKVDAIYLTIDLDCFPGSLAPGVSAVAADGLSPFQVISILDLIVSRVPLIGADIVELNPEFDRDNITARLAAFWGWWCIHHGFTSAP